MTDPYEVSLRNMVRRKYAAMVAGDLSRVAKCDRVIARLERLIEGTKQRSPLLIDDAPDILTR